MAVVLLFPVTGDYFHSTGLLDLDIHEPTNIDLAEIRGIREAVPQLVVAVNVRLPWLFGNVEPLADALLAGFDTSWEAIFDVVVGSFSPTGRLPLTFSVDNDAIAVDDEGRCASPNDVPGYDKESYMDGRRYVYVDSDGNRYQLGHGLRYA